MTATAEKPNINQGENLLVKRLSRREKQEAVAKGVFGDTAHQNKVHRLERQETIDDATLTLFAKYFGCTLEELRDTQLTLEAAPVIVNNNNNTFNDSSYLAGYIHQSTHNSEDLILKLCAEKDKHIEQLFKTLDSILEIDKKSREELTKLLASKK